jgi:hypothetical protein
VAASQAAKPAPQPPAPLRTPDLVTVLQPLSKLQRAAKPQPKPQAKSEPKPGRRAIDVGGVITRALTAAGLMK